MRVQAPAVPAARLSRRPWRAIRSRAAVIMSPPSVPIPAPAPTSSRLRLLVWPRRVRPAQIVPAVIAAPPLSLRLRLRAWPRRTRPAQFAPPVVVAVPAVPAPPSLRLRLFAWPRRTLLAQFVPPPVVIAPAALAPRSLRLRQLAWPRRSRPAQIVPAAITAVPVTSLRRILVQARRSPLRSVAVAGRPSSPQPPARQPRRSHRLRSILRSLFAPQVAAPTGPRPPELDGLVASTGRLLCVVSQQHLDAAASASHLDLAVQQNGRVTAIVFQVHTGASVSDDA
jgi:hypothetical protein